MLVLAGAGSWLGEKNPYWAQAAHGSSVQVWCWSLPLGSWVGKGPMAARHIRISLLQLNS